VKETSGFRAIGQAIHIGKTAAASVAGPKSKGQPPVELYIAKLIAQCETAEPYGAILVACRRLLPFVDDLDRASAYRLAKALRAMLHRSAVGVNAVAAALESGSGRRLTALLKEGV
jgi:hypothetical protein